MKLFTGSVAAAALALSAASAEAQLVTSVRIGSPAFVRVSDMDGPYAAMPEVPPPPRSLDRQLFPGCEARIRMRARTFTRLCDRQKFGKVEVRTAKLSQFRGHSGIGIATKTRRPGLRECCRQGRPSGDVETPVV